MVGKRPSVLHTSGNFRLWIPRVAGCMNSQPRGICVERNVSLYIIPCEPSPSFNQIRVNIKVSSKSILNSIPTKLTNVHTPCLRGS